MSRMVLVWRLGVIAMAFVYVTNKRWVFESKIWARSVWISKMLTKLVSNVVVIIVIS